MTTPVPVYDAKIVFSVVCDAHEMNDEELKRYASFERKITFGRAADSCVLVAIAPPDPGRAVPLSSFVPYRAWLVDRVRRGSSSYRAGRRTRNVSVTFDLGDEVPLLPEFRKIPKLRYGMSVDTRKIEI